MEEPCKTLLTIYEIVKRDAIPETYLVTPHEIILRRTGDWAVVEQHLEILSAAGFIIVRQLDKIAISITAVGIAKAKSLKNNFVNDNFFLPGNNQEMHTLKENNSK